MSRERSFSRSDRLIDEIISIIFKSPPSLGHTHRLLAYITGDGHQHDHNCNTLQVSRMHKVKKAPLLAS